MWFHLLIFFHVKSVFLICSHPWKLGNFLCYLQIPTVLHFSSQVRIQLILIRLCFVCPHSQQKEHTNFIFLSILPYNFRFLLFFFSFDFKVYCLKNAELNSYFLPSQKAYPIRKQFRKAFKKFFFGFAFFVLTVQLIHEL